MKKFLLIAVTFMLIFSQTAMAVSFPDVDEDTPYQDSIIWMAENGVIDGYPDGTFRPDACVNRVELLKMLLEMLEVDIYGSGYPLFPDTYADQWYAPYVRTARERGTVAGYPDGTFRPAQCVNRVEAIKMAVLEFNDGSIPDYNAYYGDPVDVDPDEWYFKYLDYALSALLVGRVHTAGQNGGDGFYFFPAGSMTRKEVAEMLYRMKALRDNDMSYYTVNIEPDPIEQSPADEVSLIMNEDNTEVTIMNDGEVVGGLTYEYPHTFEIFEKTPENVYIGVTPQGLGGYILFGGPQALFKLDLDTNALSQIEFDGTFVCDISPDETMVSYIANLGSEHAEDGRVVVKNVDEETYLHFEAPETYLQVGDVLFSPDNEKIAYAAALGDPENEESKVFIVDLDTGDQTLVDSVEGEVFSIEGWINNEEIEYGTW